MHGRVGRSLGVVLTAAALSLTTGCGDDKAPLADELSRYTDQGDGCQQVVSAIAYADDSLKPLGQERYQVFDDLVRSKLSAVSGTVALEVRDFPSKRTLRQARKVADLAARTGSLDARGRERVDLLRTYRREAAQLVLLCGREVRGL